MMSYELELEQAALSGVEPHFVSRRAPHPAAPAPIAREPHARAADARGGASVQVQALSKSYGERAVLRDVALHVAPGEFVAIVGRSGCGKSTLLRLIAGLERADAGAIRFDGGERGAARVETRMMFQDARLLPWKRVLDNVALGHDPRPATGARARATRSRRSGWPSAPATGQPCCPAGSASASRWPARWCTRRACCCWTSRWARWMR
jgi:sulfonate transport system ATP-binding protein